MDLFVSYQKLYKLSQEQKGAIREENYDRLLEILNQKKELITKIEQVNVKEFIKMQDDPEDVLARLQKLLKRTKELDTENQKNLQKSKSKLTEKMLDLNTKEKTTKSYRGEKKYEAKFIDKKN